MLKLQILLLVYIYCILIYIFNYNWVTSLNKSWWIVGYATYMNILLMLYLSRIVINYPNEQDGFNFYVATMAIITISKSIYVIGKNIKLAKYISYIVIALSLCTFKIFTLKDSLSMYISYLLVALSIYNTACYEYLDKHNQDKQENKNN